MDFSGVLGKAKDALNGLDCRSALLRYLPALIPVFGKGAVNASYTPASGWVRTEESGA